MEAFIMANELTIKDLKENSDTPACKFVVSTIYELWYDFVEHTFNDNDAFLDDDGVFPLCHPDDVDKFINYVAMHDDVVSLSKYLPEDDVQASAIISFCVKSEMSRLTRYTFK